jgi:serine protease AprX
LVFGAGGQDKCGTVGNADDIIADFSSRGSMQRRPDLMAPGRSIVSLRSSGSFIDTTYPAAQVGSEQMKGSGTSQAAAVLSGSIALLLQRYPTLKPDQVKAALIATGHPLKTSSGVQLDAGMKTYDLNATGSKVSDVLSGKIPSRQAFATGTGTGSLESARGGYHLVDPETGELLSGEVDITGGQWNPQAWAQAALDGRTWSGAQWLGRSWTGSSWSGRTWTGRTWSGSDWAGRTWTGTEWTGGTWSGRTWSGRTWSGRTWSGRTWSSADLDPFASTGA